MSREDTVEERIAWLEDSIFLLKNIIIDNERIISEINFILKKETNYFLDWFNRNKTQIDIVDIHKEVKFISFHLEQKEESQNKISYAREEIGKLQVELMQEIIDNIGDAAEVIEIIKPIYNFKNSNEGKND